MIALPQSPIPAEPVRVLLARFEDLVALGLRALIDADPSMLLVAHDVPHEELAGNIERSVPDVAVLNYGSLRRPSEIRGLHLAYPASHLVVLGNRPSTAESTQLIAFGATACIGKDTQARDVRSAIHLASRGLQLLPRPGTGASNHPLPGPDALTPREAGVLELLQQGRSNGEIARELCVSVETVRTHARHIYRKLGVRTRRELSIGA